MGIIYDLDNWVTWPEVHTAGAPLTHSEVPAADEDPLDPLFTHRMQIAAEWVFITTGAQFHGPAPYRFDPSPGWCPPGHAETSVEFRDWRRTGMGSGGRLRALELGPAPVRDVESVTVDDVVLDPGEYRLKDRRWLLRTDETSWPWPARWDEWDDPRVTVDYIAGADVPESFRRAAAMIARELVLDAVDTKASRLPAYWRSIVRDGFTVEARGMSDMQIKSGVTGLSPLIDSLLTQFPAQAQPVVAIPGQPAPSSAWTRRVPVGP